MTPFQRAGFAAGQRLVLTETDDDYACWPKGTIVTLDYDDRSNVPRFKRESDEETGYLPVRILAAVEPLGVTFEATEVKVVNTIIKVERELTADEKAAITAIIVKGNK